MDEIIKAAKSLSDPARVRVLNVLLQRECCVCEVMDALDISQVNASRYCNTLKESGFLKMHKEGRWKHYSVDWNGLAPSLKHMLEAVREAAVESPLAIEDRKRLLSAVPRNPRLDRAPSS